MTYKGQESHQTNCGGFLTIIFYTLLFGFFFQNVFILLTKGNDQFSQNKIFLDDRTNSMKLTRDNFGIQISYVGSGKDTNWDQNRYYSFRLHRYTNVRDFDESLPPTKKVQDIDIPLVPCKKNHENDNEWDYSSTMFCPDFKDTDILKGSYFAPKYSWLRLIVHRCDPKDKVMKNGVLVNKECASR